MKMKNNKDKLYYSMAEFRQRFLPRTVQEKTIEDPLVAKEFGIKMATDTMKKLKIKLTTNSS